MDFIVKNIWLVLLAVGSGVMLILPVFRRRGNEVEPAAAVRLINSRNAVVVDLRKPEEFAAGHITNARNVPLGDLKARTRELEKFKNRPLILVCAAGNRSAGAASLLRKEGFGEAVHLRGGVAAWQGAGLPLEK